MSQGAAGDLAEEVRVWAGVCDGWGSWESPCGPSQQDLAGVAACLRQLLRAFRADGEERA